MRVVIPATAIGLALAACAATVAQAQTVITQGPQQPLYDEVVTAPIADSPQPLYDSVAAPAVAPGAVFATEPYIYRYVYEPDRILVIDPASGVAVQSIPR